jgi:segregation and condensation protein B
MEQTDVLPELKQILGAMLFATGRALTVREMRRCLVEVARAAGGEAKAFGQARESEIRAALAALAEELGAAKCGQKLTEVAGGFRLQSDASCGKWVRHLLETGRPNRLSQPALETLAVVAYRQPVSRHEIESVRGVNVDHVIKTLMEIQLVRIVGRSELPGRPFLYGTTHLFLEHFGLRDLKELRDVDPALAVLPEPRGVGRPEVPEGASEPGTEDSVSRAAEEGSVPGEDET